MGLFKKKKEQTDAAQGSKNRFAGFVLLSDANWDKRKLIEDLQAQWNICVVESGKQQDDTLVFQVGKMIVTVGLMPVPVPGNEAEENARSNYLWPGAVEAAHNHRAHLIIAIMGTEADILEQGILFVKLLSSCCSQKGVLGIYSSGTVFEPRFYEECAQIIKKNGLPLLNWIWFGLWQRGSGICCYTYGMSAFGKDEMEVLDADAKPSDVRNFLLNMAAYVLENDVMLNDGETIGFSAVDKHSITCSEGVALPGMTLKIEYKKEIIDQKCCCDPKEGESGMRKRNIIILGSAIFIIMIGITGCNAVKTTSNPTPEQVYSNDNNVDMFVYEDIVYINAADIDWVKNETFDKSDMIGKISESGITSDFENWDATVLPVGTEIYESDDAQILLASSGEQLIPYLKWVEG